MTIEPELTEIAGSDVATSSFESRSRHWSTREGDVRKEIFKQTLAHHNISHTYRETLRAMIASFNDVGYINSENEFVDVKNPDHAKFPNFKNIEPDYYDTLSPGEIILFPSGWFHDVTCLTDSVSITWNFVHETQLERVCNHISKNPEDDQLEILQYFLKNEVPENVTSKELVEFFQNKFAEKV